MKKNISKLEQNLGFKINNLDLYIKAITHKSADKNSNYEKLEFLGDRVLGLCISKKLLEIFPNEKEGILDKKLASLVNKNKCFEVGQQLKLDKYIKNPKSNIFPPYSHQDLIWKNPCILASKCCKIL